MNYDELVKALRYEASYAYLGSDGERLSKMMRDAADAIEELQKRLCESIPKSDAEIIISEVAKPRWISVKERLPGDEDFLLFAPPKDIIIGYYDRDDKIFCDLSGFQRLCEYWMPLPAPPKED